MACYEQAIAMEPDNWEAYHHWGDALRELERWEKAGAAYNQSLELKPDFDWSHYNLGQALVQQEKWDEAISKRSAKLCAAYESALYELRKYLLQIQ